MASLEEENPFLDGESEEEELFEWSPSPDNPPPNVEGEDSARVDVCLRCVKSLWRADIWQLDNKENELCSLARIPKGRHKCPRCSRLRKDCTRVPMPFDAQANQLVHMYHDNAPVGRVRTAAEIVQYPIHLLGDDDFQGRCQTFSKAVDRWLKETGEGEEGIKGIGTIPAATQATTSLTGSGINSTTVGVTITESADEAMDVDVEEESEGPVVDGEGSANSSGTGAADGAFQTQLLSVLGRIAGSLEKIEKKMR